MNLLMVIFCVWLWTCTGLGAADLLTPENIGDPAMEDEFRTRNRGAATDAEGFFQLGEFYAYHQRYREAAVAYERATVLRPDWFEAFFALGKTRRDLGRYMAAEQALSRALALKDDHFMVHHMLGLLYMRSGRYKEAAVAFTRAVDLNPGWAEDYYRDHRIKGHPELENKEDVLAVVKILNRREQRVAQLLWWKWSQRQDQRRMWSDRSE